MIEIYKVNRNLQVRTQVDYDQFFHSNICHICKSTNQDNLIVCNMCGMIAYCTEDHRILHEPYHHDICIIITWHIAQDPLWYIRRLNTDEWIEFQQNIMLKVRALLTRKLKPYEEQMFMFARSCFVCHQRTNLSTCGRCISISYCVDHASLTSSHQGFDCFQTALSVNLDIIFLEQTAWKPLYVKFYSFPDGTFLTDTRSFCNRYYRKRSIYQTWGFNNYAFSDYVSDPLTLYAGLHSIKLFSALQLMNIYVVHIIGANYVNRRNFPAWELFLHLLGKKAKLVITMIGPESKHETNELEVCSRCKEAKRRLILQSYPLLYHNYISNTDYRRPNVIVGFQAEFNGKSTWSESIKAIQIQNCPLVLTATSLFNARKNSTTIKHTLGKRVKPDLVYLNNFKSNRPYRDLNHEIFFRNTYSMIYKDLNVSSN